MRRRIHVSSYPCVRQVGTCRSHQDVKPDSISEASQHEASMSISRYCSRVTRLASSAINRLLSGITLSSLFSPLLYLCSEPLHHSRPVLLRNISVPGNP